MLTDPLFVAIGIPVVLILCGAFAKKIVRGPGWQPADFFRGVELSLTSLASALVYTFDLAKQASSAAGPTPDLWQKAAGTAGFIALCFGLLLVVLSAHQDWEKRPQNPLGQWIWLGGLANLIGVGLLAGFVCW